MGASMAVMGLVGGYVQANAQKEAGKSQRDLAERQAQLAEYQATDAIDRGEIAELRRRQQARSQAGTQRAGYAGQGVLTTTGSPADVISDTAGMAEADVATIRRNAQLEAWGYRTGAADSRARGAIAEQAGQQQAFGTLLGSASRAGWYAYGGSSSGVARSDPGRIRPPRDTGYYGGSV